MNELQFIHCNKFRQCIIEILLSTWISLKKILRKISFGRILQAFIKMKNSTIDPLNNMRTKDTDPHTVKNPHITFDAPKI